MVVYAGLGGVGLVVLVLMLVVGAIGDHDVPIHESSFDHGDLDGHGGAPVLAGCVAVFECRRHGHQVAGDHVLFIGEVQRLTGSSATPLVYHGGHYRRLEALS